MKPFYLQRRFWLLRNIIFHPVDNYHWYYKWWHRPKIGDRVEDCRNEIHTVVRINDKDTLHFEDGHSASWMNCCDTVKHHEERMQRDS